MTTSPGRVGFKLIRAAGVMILLFGITACSTRKVDLRLGSRPVESLTARAERSQGVWTLDMELPTGRWKATIPDEGIAVRILEREGRNHARFDLPEGRISESKPFRLLLQAVDKEGNVMGAPFEYTMKTRFPGQGLVEFLFVLRFGRVSY